MNTKKDWKKAWYHGPNSKLGMFTYTCEYCGHLVEKEDEYCHECGVTYDGAIRKGFIRTITQFGK